MEVLVMLAKAGAYFGVFLIACGFLWWVSYMKNMHSGSRNMIRNGLSKSKTGRLA